MRTVFVCVAALVLSGCIGPFDHSKLIAEEERSYWWGDKYTQDGVPIDVLKMMYQLESEELARPHAERWRRYYYGETATLISGSASMGLGISELARRNGATGWTLLGAGAGLFVTSRVLVNGMRSAAHDAVAAHNAMIWGAPRSSGGPLAGPWIVALPDPRGGAAHVAGIVVTF